MRGLVKSRKRSQLDVLEAAPMQLELPVTPVLLQPSRRKRRRRSLEVPLAVCFLYLNIF